MKTKIEGLHYKTNMPVGIDVSGESISEVHLKESIKSTDIIAPGLVDLQVNGFKGIDFNQGALPLKEITSLTQTLWKEGITTYFPTLITNSDTNTMASIKSIVAACNDNNLINASIGGIHLEGPFLSSEDGPRGAHPVEYIKAPDWDLFCNWQEAAAGRIKIITLAPEWSGAIEFIQKCVASGVLVSIGHTAANAEQIQNALKAGARMSTHLGNATHLMLPRHHNYIWEQLSSESLWASLIADGFHLPNSVLNTFLKVKPEKSILVSDATKFAGLSPGCYESHIGGEVELDASGRLSMKHNPEMLAGSAQSLLWCIDFLANSDIVSLSQAIDMASLKPMELLRTDGLYGLEKTAKADLIIFNRTSDSTDIIKTIKSGEVVHSC